MEEQKTWDEFRATGLLWFINTILHMFGWAIVINYDENVVYAYPARCKFRGFTEELNTKGYQKVTKFLKENVNDLLKEAMDGEESDE